MHSQFLLLQVCHIYKSPLHKHTHAHYHEACPIWHRCLVVTVLSVRLVPSFPSLPLFEHPDKWKPLQHLLMLFISPFLRWRAMLHMRLLCSQSVFFLCGLKRWLLFSLHLLPTTVMAWGIHNSSIIDFWLEPCISAKMKRKAIFISLECTITHTIDNSVWIRFEYGFSQIIRICMAAWETHRMVKFWHFRRCNFCQSVSDHRLTWLGLCLFQLSMYCSCPSAWSNPDVRCVRKLQSARKVLDVFRQTVCFYDCVCWSGIMFAERKPRQD